MSGNNEAAGDAGGGLYAAKWLNEDEQAEFNAFVCAHPKGHALQLWQWGEIKEHTGWQPHRLVLTRAGAIVAAASVLERRLPVVGSPVFYCPRGPVADPHDEEVMAAVFRAIRDLARRRGAILLKIDPDVSVEDVDFGRFLRAQGFRPLDKGRGFEGVQPKFVFRLDIRPEEDELLAAMQQKTRYNIRLAMKKGVEITRGTREDLPDFYAVLKETTERDNFLVRDFGYFADMYDTLTPAGFGELFLARCAGRVVAGALVFRAGDKAWYVYGASSNAHRNVMPNYLIQWEMIRWAKSLGCAMYDFRGVSGDLSESNPLYGLYRFKKGWGGVFTEFIGEWDLVFRPVMYRLWQAAEKLYSGWLKKFMVNIRSRFRL
ncbi:MAG: peptidoglycan bridge formation glycyltransferase FemA/FemB family protein [Gracilibacteraceae bacterium]|jgi:lipid II:glycine glycyltransferase (peptidoglycan interpeptide bridge formation enzyme)|nr:peptidoglycan bridge formation glycyltransferase FemA/FemB family protein [Gracilibacteraceae bacterium]